LVKIENFPNAYKEVYEILKYVPKEDIELMEKFVDDENTKYDKVTR